jgi:hypothetical protein
MNPEGRVQCPQDWTFCHSESHASPAVKPCRHREISRAPKKGTGTTAMKPYPLVGDLREPVQWVALPCAQSPVVGQELVSYLRRIQGLAPER